MGNNQLDNIYKSFIKYLISNGFKYKKEITIRSYQNENIIVKFDSKNITIQDSTDNRRYFFEKDTSNTFLINFLNYLDNNKVII